MTVDIEMLPRLAGFLQQNTKKVELFFESKIKAHFLKKAQVVKGFPIWSTDMGICILADHFTLCSVGFHEFWNKVCTFNLWLRYSLHSPSWTTINGLPDAQASWVVQHDQTKCDYVVPAHKWTVNCDGLLLWENIHRYRWSCQNHKQARRCAAGRLYCSL